MAREIWLIRHGQTEWSLSGAHTGRTDLPLTGAGRANATALGRYLAPLRFRVVLSSPLARALDTCRLAGFGDAARIDANLCEWNYGDYEGRTTAEIRAGRPDWLLWRDGVPNGETLAQVGARADAVLARDDIAQALQEGANVALFAHGHLLRILAARWLGLPPDGGRLLVLSAGSAGSLGYERETRVITRWNLTPWASPD